MAGREEVRLSHAERDALERVLAAGADVLYDLEYRDQPTLEGFTLRATERGYIALLELVPISVDDTPDARLIEKILDALDRYGVRALESAGDDR